jgi:hypothetical protein
VIIATTTLASPVMPIVLSASGEVAVYTPASSVTQSCRRFHGRIEICLLQLPEPAADRLSVALRIAMDGACGH